MFMILNVERGICFILCTVCVIILGGCDLNKYSSITCFNYLILGHKCVPVDHPSVSAIRTLNDQLSKLNSISSQTKTNTEKELEILTGRYEDKRREIDMFFDDLKSRCEIRRLELQRELLEVCEKEEKD